MKSRLLVSVVICFAFITVYFITDYLLIGFQTWHNWHDNEGGESLITLITILIGIPTVWWIIFPRYTAVCCHDGKRWLDVPGVWSAVRGVEGNDLEQFTKQWLGQALTGRFLTHEQARLPVNPRPRFHHIKFFGKNAGIYYVVGVRIFDQGLLEKFKRLNYAPVEFEVSDEYLNL